MQANLPIRRLAVLSFSVASVLVLATCDLDKLIKPKDGTDGAAPFDSTELQLTGVSSLTLGGTGTMDVTSPTVSLQNVLKRFYSSNPQFITVDSITGALTGVALGTSKLTAKIIAPELPTGVTISTNLRVKYKGIRITSIPTGDSITGLAQTRTLSIFGLNNANATVGSALTADSLRSRDTTTLRITGTTVNARKGGTTYLVAFFDGLRDSVALKVRQVAKSIAFPTTDFTARHLNYNMSVPVTVRDVSDSIIAAPTITWRTKDTTAATIGASSGLLRMKKVQNDTVWAKMDTVERAQRIVVQQMVASVLKTSGDNQTATVNTGPAVNVTVQAVDSGNTGVPNVDIRFRVGAGGGFIGDSAKVTNAGGFATTNNWLLGTTVGANTLNAVAINHNNLTASFTANGTAGAAAKLGFKVQPTSRHVLSTHTPSPTVEVQDQFGNLVSSATHAVTLGLASNPGGSAITGTLTANAVNGVATFPNIGVPTAGTGYTMSATAGGLAAGTSNTFDMFGGATKLVWLQEPIGSAVGVASPAPIRVAVKDAQNVTVTTSTHFVDLAIQDNPGSAILTGKLGASVVNGVATFDSVVFSNPGAGYTLTASSFGIGSATTSPFDVAGVGAAAQVTFGGQPLGAAAGAAFPQFAVRAVDANGAGTANFNGQVTLSLSPNPQGVSLTGNTATMSSGVAAFNNVRVDKTGTYNLVVSALGLTSSTSNAFTVTPGTGTQLGFKQGPTNSLSGSTMPVTVAVQDASGNTATGHPASTVTLSTNGCGITLGGATSTQTVSGVASFSNLTATGFSSGCTLTASAPGLTSITSTAFQVSPSANTPVAVSFLSEPAGGVAGANMPAFSVGFLSAGGSAVAPGQTVQLALTVMSGPGAIGGQSSVNTNLASNNFTLSFQAAGTYRLIASAPGFKPDTSVPFAITPGAASKLVFTRAPTNNGVGIWFSPDIRVEVQDAAGNVVPTATPQVTLGISTDPAAGTAVLGTATRNAVAGVADFGDVRLDKPGVGFALTASSPGLTSATSPAFTVTSPGVLMSSTAGTQFIVSGASLEFIGPSYLGNVGNGGRNGTNTFEGVFNGRSYLGGGIFTETGSNNTGTAAVKRVKSGAITTLASGLTNLIYTFPRSSAARVDGKVYFIAKAQASAGNAIKVISDSVPGTPTDLFVVTGAGTPWFIVNGGFIYYQDPDLNVIRRMTTAGADQTTLTTDLGVSGGKPFAMDGTTLYFASAADIRSIANAPSAVGPVGPTTNFTLASAYADGLISDSFMYIRGSGGTEIRKYAMPAFTFSVIGQGRADESPMGADANFLYFYDSSSAMKLVKVRK